MVPTKQAAIEVDARPSSDPEPTASPPPAGVVVDETTIPDRWAEYEGLFADGIDIAADVAGRTQLSVHRVEPRYHGRLRIDGFLRQYSPPLTLQDIQEQFGGGTFRIDRRHKGQFAGTVTVQISGPPKTTDDALPEDIDGEGGISVLDGRYSLSEFREILDLARGTVNDSGSAGPRRRLLDEVLEVKALGQELGWHGGGAAPGVSADHPILAAILDVVRGVVEKLPDDFMDRILPRRTPDLQRRGPGAAPPPRRTQAPPPPPEPNRGGDDDPATRILGRVLEGYRLQVSPDQLGPALTEDFPGLLRLLQDFEPQACWQWLDENAAEDLRPTLADSQIRIYATATMEAIRAANQVQREELPGDQPREDAHDGSGGEAGPLDTGARPRARGASQGKGRARRARGDSPVGSK